MNKKEVLYTIVVLIIATIAFSAPEESLYSGVIRDTKIIEADNYKFTIKVSDNGIRVTNDRNAFRVSKGECEGYRNFRFCIGTPTKSGNSYRVPIVITEQPGLFISKTIEPTELATGQKAYVSVHLRNDGNTDIESIHLKDRYPPQLEVTILEDTCWLRDNVVSWGGSLKPGETVKCRYSLTAHAPGEYITEAQAVHYDRTENKISSGKAKIVVS